MNDDKFEKDKKPGLLNNRHFRNKLIIIVAGILLFYIALYVNSKNGFITSLLGKKTIEIETPGGR